MSNLGSFYGGRKTLHISLPDDIPDFGEFKNLVDDINEVNDVNNVNDYSGDAYEAAKILGVFERILEAGGYYGLYDRDPKYKLDDIFPNEFVEKLNMYLDYIVKEAASLDNYILLTYLIENLDPMLSNYLKHKHYKYKMEKSYVGSDKKFPLFDPVTYDDITIPFQKQTDKISDQALYNSEKNLINFIENSISPDLLSDSTQYEIAQDRMSELIENSYPQAALKLHDLGVVLTDDKKMELLKFSEKFPKLRPIFYESENSGTASARSPFMSPIQSPSRVEQFVKTFPMLSRLFVNEEDNSSTSPVRSPVPSKSPVRSSVPSSDKVKYTSNPKTLIRVEYVMNPKTGRQIQVRGPTFNKLREEGYQYIDGRLKKM